MDQLAKNYITKYQLIYWFWYILPNKINFYMAKNVI